TTIELRSADGKLDRLPDLAAELVRLGVDVVVASETPAVQAAKRATSDIPIVMAPSGDPVGTGLIASLGKPGGNVTGLSAATAELAGKSLELIREVLPAAIIELARQHRLPAVSGNRAFADAGGLMSYAGSLADRYRNAAPYVDKILKGTKPADLPVQQPTRFELVINMKTAQTLGLVVP